MLCLAGKLTHEDITKWGVRGAGPKRDDPESQSVYFFGIIDILQAWTAKKVWLQERVQEVCVCVNKSSG